MRTQAAQKTTAALLDMPEDPPREKPRARRNNDARRTGDQPAGRESSPARRVSYPDDDSREYVRARGKRVRRGLIPQSKYGRVAAGVGLTTLLGGTAFALFSLQRFMHRDAQFTIPSSSAIELNGNQHLSRSQLLSVFGEDVERNIFNVPMAERKEELEQIPWVEHATIMRLLPNHLRVHVVERTPIAFVRQGGTIGMADASGVLLDIPPDAPGNPNYSFPVVTGLKAEDSAASRAQRMHLYSAFLKDLDSGGKKISAELSEVDLSDPEDVKALLPNNNAEILVHFGTEHFLERYNRFQEHVAEWRQTYPRLSSVDMRYERQVVLQMPPKDATLQPAVEAKSPEAPLAATPVHTASKPLATPKPVALAATPPKPSSMPNPGPTRTAAVRPEPKAFAVHRAEPPATGKRADAKRAEMAKRVEAIKAWMAKRQAARAQ